jgi:crooked neck
MMPIVSKRRHVDQETGQTVEDWDLVFADDEREAHPASFKLLQMAHAWKGKLATPGAANAGSGKLSGFVSAPTSLRQKPADRQTKEDEEEESDAASSGADDDGD